jgi:hypothetical protein
MSQQSSRNRPNHLARRAVAVSAGAFVLCLAGASPALADLAPVPVPDPSPVTDALSPVTDLVEPVVPVKETVKSVEQQLNDSGAVTTTEPKPRTPKPTIHDGDTTTTTTRHHRARHHEQRLSASKLMEVPPTNYASWPGPVADMPGLRSAYTAAAADPVEAPAVAAPAAPEHSVISLAGGTLRDLGDAGTPAGRTVLVILSTLAIGSLAGGHVKMAQERLTRLA